MSKINIIEKFKALPILKFFKKKEIEVELPPEQPQPHPLEFFKDSKQRIIRYGNLKPVNFQYNNLEFIRNLLISYENIEIEGLTIEYILEPDLFQGLDEHLFYTLREDEELEYRPGAEVLDLEIKGVWFRFINKAFIPE
jgi:hypothetical protein